MVLKKLPANETKSLGIPRRILLEINEFKQRNLIIKYREKNICCERCLKAHALKKVGEFGLEDEVRGILNWKFRCHIGHGGYYLDEERLVKI